MQKTNTHQLLRLPDLMRLTGLSRSWIYKSMADGGPEAFPKNRKISAASVWDAAEVDAWIAARLGKTAAPSVGEA